MSWRIGFILVDKQGEGGEVDTADYRGLQQLLGEQQWGEIVQKRIVAHYQDAIAIALIECSDILQVDLVVTIGGTGFAPHDVTPEATLKVVERLAPGIAEALRFFTQQKTPHAILSRGVAGIRRNTLIINLPDDPSQAYDGLVAVLTSIDQALNAIHQKYDVKT